jgi:hypothetical protein
MELKKYFVSLLEETGSLTHTLDTLDCIKEQILHEMKLLGENPKMMKLLSDRLLWKSSCD